MPDVAPSRSSAGHRDYSATPLARKLGIREGSRVLVVGAPSGFSLGPVPTRASFARSARGPLDVVLLFTTTLADLRRRFPTAVRALDPAGRLWVAWPKKAAQVGTGPSEKPVGAPRTRTREPSRIPSLRASGVAE